MAGPRLTRSVPRPEPPARQRDEVPAWWWLLAAAGLLALLAGALLAMGRVSWCECGYVKLWHGVVQSSENSQHLTDWYTPTHIVHGGGLYGLLWLVGRTWPLGLRLTLATAVEVAWEIVENTDLVINRATARRPSRSTISAIASSTRKATFWPASRVSFWPPGCRSGRRSRSRS
jgi:Protein of unknown function (DUF2585)